MPGSVLVQQQPRPARARIPRTKSSLLAFKLREFLNTENDTIAGDNRISHSPATLPAIAEHRAALHRAAALEHGASKRPAPAKQDCVWVDAFFYGFWMPQSKVADYQQSLQQHGGAALVAPVR